MEVIIDSSRGFSLVEALSRCLGLGKENSVSLFCSNRELEDFDLPAAEKQADSSPTPESDSPAADPAVTRTSPRVRLQAALPLPTVPTPGGSTGSGGKRN